MSREQQYIEWNQLTRHQLIVAHMTLIDSLQDSRKRLAALVSLPEATPLDQLVAAVEDAVT